MRRREFIVFFGAAVSWPITAHAQQKAMPVIGLLGAAFPDPAVALNLVALREGLGELGYVEGRNITIEYRWAEGYYERLPALAADLVGHNVDVIVTEGGAPSTRAAKAATSTIPIVFHTMTDPVADGLVASLARPGGNLTGVSLLGVELSPKVLQLLAELVPQAKMIAVLVNPNSPNAEPAIREMQKAIGATGAQLRVLEAGSASGVDAGFTKLADLHGDALVVVADAFFTTRRDQLVALAARHAIPAIYTRRIFPASGGLLSYGASLPEVYRQKGIYTGRILNGAKPADLPIVQPTKFELVINLKTARALGLTVPPAVLAQADELIE
jgi:putative ABC transport system substrate-binding protein